MNAMMVPNEEQEHINSSNGHVPVPCFSPLKSNVASSSSSSKKNKSKIPQRGLGVAQLERLRLEELQRKNAKSLSTPFSQELCLVQQQACSNVTKPDIVSFVSSNSMSSSTVMTVGMDFFVPVQHQGVRNCGNGLMPTVWRAMPPCKHNSVTSNSISCNISQRLQTQMQLANTQMNGASSSRSPEVVNTPMEPPSNQNYTSSRFNLLTYWRGQEKDRQFERDQEVGVGKKRTWPFQVDSVITQPPYPCKVPSLFNSYIKPDGILPCCGNSVVDSEIPNCTFRVSSSNCNFEWQNYDLHHAKNTRDNGVAVDSTTGTALSLAPTTPTVVNSMGSSVNFLHSNEKTFYSFLPSHEDSHRTSSSEQKGDIVDGLDLSLKL